MQAHKMKVTVPEDHQVEICLPRDFPSGPAEIIVLAVPPGEEASKRDSGQLLEALESLRAMERTAEEERVLEDFDRFQQAHPFELVSLADKD